jgi:hypothetical protein
MSIPSGWHNYGSYRPLKEEWLHLSFSLNLKDAREGLSFRPFKARKESL